jgi:hypothetical protein
MRCIKGLSFCVVCGHWAMPSGACSRGMHKDCAGYATKRGTELLARLARQPPKLPDLHGRKAWPDGTPVASPTALAAVGRKRRGTGDPPNARGRTDRPVPHPSSNLSPAERRIQAVFARVRARLPNHSPPD